MHAMHSYDHPWLMLVFSAHCADQFLVVQSYKNTSFRGQN